MDLRIIMKNTSLCHNSLKLECCLMASKQFILNCPRDAKTHKRITHKKVPLNDKTEKENRLLFMRKAFLPSVFKKKKFF